MKRILTTGGLIAALALVQAVKADTLELASVTLGSTFSTTESSVSTNDGTQATASIGGQRTVTGFALPVSMFSQAFANADPHGAGLRVIVDMQNAINTGGVIGFSNDPNLFDSSVGFTLDAQTLDQVSFSAGASVVFTWTIHEHMVNLSSSSSATFEEATFGFTPNLSDNNTIWSCTHSCSIGTPVPGTGNVFDFNITETQRRAFTPGQVFGVFDRMTLAGTINSTSVQQNEHVDLDFLDPVTVSAQVFDAQGNPLTNVTATSALGVNYLGAPTGTPEPGTSSLIAVGLLAIGSMHGIKAVKRRRSCSTQRVR